MYLFATICLLSSSRTAMSQETDSRFRINLKNRFLSITANKADVRNILSEISESTGIHVSFPNSIKRQITIKLVNVPLAEAFRTLLHGLNYAVIYSFFEKKNQYKVSKVYVLPKSKISSSAIRNQNITDRRIHNYEQRIRSITERMSGINPNDPRRRNYENQIRNYQRLLDRIR